ncbi:MAG TPA: hypothetical protein VK808_08200 [Bacteroidia bacterium]|nr:hypothetical protein [Bacteroidia bacterium]
MKYVFIVFLFVLPLITAEAQDTIDNSIDTSRYPRHSLLYNMRFKADSIVKSIYGEKFFNSQLKWDQKDSYYFNIYSNDDALPFKWPDMDTNVLLRKTEFSIRYDICYSSGIMKSGIQILIDAAGNLLPRHAWMNYKQKIYTQGFEKIDTTDSEFKLTTEEAIRLACNNGLQAKDTARIYCNLVWYPANDSTTTIDSGNFYFEVGYNPEFTKGQRRRFQKGDEVQYSDYVWLYDPWTKELVRKTTNRLNFKTSRRY